MTNEEFQRLVLEKLTGLEHGQGKLEQRQAKLEEGQVKLEKRINEVESVLTTRIEGLNVKVNTLNTKVEALDVKVNTLDTKINALDTKIEKYGQIQQDDVKGMLDLIDKKLDRVVETQIIQGESINILALRQLQTESELAALKKAL